MLLRNIDQASGLCNGTRLQVRDLGKNIIKASNISGKHVGEMVFLPRMDLVPSDSRLPFKFTRRQFPICLCFAMTINKSQGQSISKVRLYLPRPVFTHGQLYVAISRVTTKKGLKILILDDDGKPCTTTLNVKNVQRTALSCNIATREVPPSICSLISLATYTVVLAVVQSHSHRRPLSLSPSFSLSLSKLFPNCKISS
ncbi:hypothetical protein TSUD_402040 [Trifolium subterraneum]|uniref:DNA helicase Pif1-like 2B domain-containing protein n=1 Tax=Trifolium subterraneum TaxID=3900 RepID=A0A2Z6PC16_TRISU|nr:hypothetical protein TSUD_402040 [Trifolium subterraneum]